MPEAVRINRIISLGDPKIDCGSHVGAFGNMGNIRIFILFSQLPDHLVDLPDNSGRFCQEGLSETIV